MKKGIIALSALLLVMIAGLSATSPGLFSASVIQTVDQNSSPTVVKIIQGDVFVNGQKIQQTTVLHTGDTVKTAENAFAEILFSDKSVSRLAENTELEMKELPDPATGKGNILMKAISGEVWSKIMKIIGVQSKFEIQTETTVAAVRGSAFNVQLTACGTEVIAAEHTVWFENMSGEKDAVVTEGEKGIFDSCKASEIVVKDASAEMKADWFQENSAKDAEHEIQAIQEIQKERASKVSLDPSSALYFFQEMKDSFSLSDTTDSESLLKNIDFVNQKLFELEVFFGKDGTGDVSNVLDNIEKVIKQVQGNVEFQSKLFSVLASHHETLFDAQVGTGLYDLRKNIESWIVSLASTKKEQEYIQNLILARRVIDVYDALDSNVSAKILEKEMQELENTIVKLGVQSSLNEQFGTAVYSDKVKEEVKVKAVEEIQKNQTSEERKTIETIQKTLEKEKSGSLLEDANYVYQESVKETFVAPVEPVKEEEKKEEKKEEPTFIEKVKEVVTEILPFQEEAEIKPVETPAVKEEKPVALAQETKPVVIESAVVQNSAPTLKKIKQDDTVLLGDEKDLGKVSVLLEDKDSADEIDSLTFALNPEINAKDAGVRFVWQKTKTPESVTCSGGGFIHQVNSGFGKEFLQVRSCAIVKNTTQLQIDADFTVSEKLKNFGENTFSVAFAKINNEWNWQTVSHTAFSVLSAAPVLEVKTEEAGKIIWKWKPSESAIKYILASPSESVRFELLPANLTNVNGFIEFAEPVTEENQNIERKIKAVTAVAEESLHPFGATTSVFTKLPTPQLTNISVADRTSNSLKVLVKEPAFNAQLDQTGAEFALFNAQQEDVTASVSKENIGKYQVIFNGLTPNTEYFISVRYKNAVGNSSDFSAKKSVKTYNNALGSVVCTPSTATVNENGKEWFGETLEMTCSFPEGFVAENFKNARIQYKTDGTDPNCDAGESVWTAGEKKNWTESTVLQARLCDDLGNKGDLLNKVFVKDKTAPSCSNVNWTTTDAAGLNNWKASGSREFIAEYASVADLESGITVPEEKDRICSAAENKSCSVTIKDRVGNTVKCDSPVNKVDTQKPKSPVCSSTSAYFASTVNMVCQTPEDTGTLSSGNLSVRFQENIDEKNPNLTCSTGSEYSGTLSFNSTTKVGFIACDGVGNASAISYVSVTKDDSKPECGTWSPTQAELDAKIKNKTDEGFVFTLTGSKAASGMKETSYSCAVNGGKDNETCEVKIESTTGQTNTCVSPKNRVDDTVPTAPTLVVEASSETISWVDVFFDSLFAEDEAWKPLTKNAWTSLKKARVKIEVPQTSLTSISYFYCVDKNVASTADACDPNVSFSSSADFSLTEGKNTLRVKGCDGGGCSSVSEFIIQGDFTAPSCTTALKSTDFTSGSVELKASEIDDGNGSGVDETKQSSKMVAENGNHFVEITDKAGNAAKCSAAKVENIDTQSPKTGNWTLSNTADKEFVWSVQCSDEKSGCKQDVYSCKIADQNAQCEITLEDTVGHKQKVASPSTVYVSKWKAQYPNTEDEKNWECSSAECKIYANSFVAEELTAVASSAQTQPAPRSIFQTKTSYPLAYSSAVWSAFTCNEQNCQQVTEITPTAFTSVNKNIQPAPMQNVVWSQTGTQNFVGRKTLPSFAWYKLGDNYDSQGNKSILTKYCSNATGETCAEDISFILNTKPEFTTGTGFISGGLYSRKDNAFAISRTTAGTIAVCFGENCATETPTVLSANACTGPACGAILPTGKWFAVANAKTLSLLTQGEQTQTFAYKIWDAQGKLVEDAKNRSFKVEYCGAGEYLSGESCVPVQAGYFSPAHNNDLVECSANFFCPGKSSDAGKEFVRTLLASENTQLGATDSVLRSEGKIACPAGYTTNLSKTNDSIDDCLSPAGWYFNGTAFAKTPVNTYSIAGENDKHDCTAGGSYAYEGSSTCSTVSLSVDKNSVFVGETVKVTANKSLVTGESYAWYADANCNTSKQISGSAQSLDYPASAAGANAISTQLVLPGAVATSKCTSISFTVNSVAAPAGFAVSAVANGFQLTWNRITNPDVQKYKIDLIDSSHNNAAEIVSAICTSATCSTTITKTSAYGNIVPNGQFSFVLYAEGSTNKTAKIEKYSLATTPVIGDVSATDSTITLNWSGNGSRYKVYEQFGTGVNYLYQGNQTTYTYTGLAPATQYNFLIIAINEVGGESEPLRVSMITGIAQIAPAPTNTITVNGKTITVADADETGTMSWSAASAASAACAGKGMRLPNSKAEFDAMNDAGMLSGSVYWGGEEYQINKSRAYAYYKGWGGYDPDSKNNTWNVRCVKD